MRVPRLGGVLYASWDLSSIDLVDERRGEVLCAIYPLDKSANSDGIRRHLELPEGADLDVHLITNPIVRLDVPDDRKRLLDTVQMVGPTLLVLDPFVRLHRIDENHAAEVAPLLATLREIQRQIKTAVLLVHHARKSAAHARAGQALRGSSELHAWGDSNLYLRRRADQLRLSVEQRAAPAQADVFLKLEHMGDALALAVVEEEGPVEADGPSLTDRILDVLAASEEPLSLRALRERCRIRASTLSAALQDLIASRRVVRTDQGYRLHAA